MSSSQCLVVKQQPIEFVIFDDIGRDIIEAFTICKSINATLTVVEDEPTFQFVQDFLDNQSQVDRAWIGLFRRNGVSFDDPSLFGFIDEQERDKSFFSTRGVFPWKANEPNGINQLNQEALCFQWEGNRWIDQNCFQKSIDISGKFLPSYTLCTRECTDPEFQGELPTENPTQILTKSPTKLPTEVPTDSPTDLPTDSPTDLPTDSPTDLPTDSPTDHPTNSPTANPTKSPSLAPIETQLGNQDDVIYRKDFLAIATVFGVLFFIFLTLLVLKKRQLAKIRRKMSDIGWASEISNMARFL